MTVSQTAVNSVISSIRSGNTSHVEDFFAARPDWQEETEETEQVETDCPEGFYQKSPNHLPEPLPESYWID